MIVTFIHNGTKYVLDDLGRTSEVRLVREKIAKMADINLDELTYGFFTHVSRLIFNGRPIEDHTHAGDVADLFFWSVKHGTTVQVIRPSQ